MIPTVGFVSGQAYFQKYVVEPNHCTPLHPKRMSSDAKNLTEIAATCVLITSPDNEKQTEYYGRVVLSSSNYMLIYHPEIGLGERIPIANAVIRSIDDDGMAELGQAKN